MQLHVLTLLGCNGQCHGAVFSDAGIICDASWQAISHNAGLCDIHLCSFVFVNCDNVFSLCWLLLKPVGFWVVGGSVMFTDCAVQK